MVKAELTYNPYLNETKVKFNGREPRINSKVEKYCGTMLHAWLSELPEIFYEEMNGFDFDLDFIGTKMDYEDLHRAFAEAGISTAQVRLFHRNEIDERSRKIEIIDKILEWLENNPNRQLDFVAFRKDNEELFEGKYSYIILQGKEIVTERIENEDVAIEHIDEVSELRGTNLKNIPILIFINKSNISKLQYILKYLLARVDVIQEQLFFLLVGQEKSKMERILVDLGIARPQIIERVYDSSVEYYFNIYPVTDYIYQSALAFRTEAEKLRKSLDVLIEESEEENREIYKRLKELETAIELLKNSLSQFSNRDVFSIPATWKSAEDSFIKKIQTWRSKKTVITNEQDAEIIAMQFENAAYEMLDGFQNELESLAVSTRSRMKEEFASWYKSAQFDDGFQLQIKSIPFNEVKMPWFPQLQRELLKIKEAHLVQKEAFLGKLFKGEGPKEEMEVIWHYQMWRDYVQRTLKPLSERLIQAHFRQIEDMLNTTAEQYIEHIKETIAELSEQKENTAQQLSADEQLLQDDNNWLNEFMDQIKVLERE